MGSNTDKVKGYANEAAGKVKQGVGKTVGNDRLRAKGAAQVIKGDAQKALGKARGASSRQPTRCLPRPTRSSNGKKHSVRA